jgi:hypothetical protein
MSRSSQHLYELLETDQFNEVVFSGLLRLLNALEERVVLSSRASADEMLFETSDGRTFLVSSSPETRSKMIWDFKEEFHDVRSILATMALSENYADLEAHMRDFLYETDNVLDNFKHRRDYNPFVETSKDETAARRTPPPNAATQSDHWRAADAWGSPFLKFLNKINAQLGPDIHRMRKDDLKSYIANHWDDDSLGERSEKKIDGMATLLRTREAQQGRAKPKL